MPAASVVGVRLLGLARAVRADREVPLGRPRQWALLAQARAVAELARIPLHPPAAVPQALPSALAGEPKDRWAVFKGDGQAPGPDRRSARW